MDPQQLPLAARENCGSTPIFCGDRETDSVHARAHIDKGFAHTLDIVRLLESKHA